MCFSLLSMQCHGVVTCQRLSLCFRPIGPRNAIPFGHQNQVLKEYPLCGLCLPTGCGMVSCGCSVQEQGAPTGARRLRGGVRTASTSTGTNKAEEKHRNSSCQCLHPQRESQKLSASLADEEMSLLCIQSRRLSNSCFYAGFQDEWFCVQIP